MLLVADIGCSQSDTNINQCTISHFTKTSTCDVKDIAAVRCYSKKNHNTKANIIINFVDCTNGEIRLIPDTRISYNSLIGRVGVCVNGSWATICSGFFFDADAKVVCRELGYSALGN